MTHTLLTRDSFREDVFKRDKNQCVICKSPAADAHHILERRLWPDGGYYLNNGASVCEPCHIKCETTEISVEEIREAAGIVKKIIPPHLYDDQIYDKWGNPILPNKQRVRGELFFDESVQKILEQGKVLDLFTSLVKYPRTYHLPWSENVNDDDRVMTSLEHLDNKEITVTEKMDGENSTLYSDYIHARSVDGRSHPTRDWLKQFWGQIKQDIPKDWRVCGENLFAKHSISYDNLNSYFYGFSIWNDKNVCLPWDETLEWFELLNIVPVPVLYRGIFDQKLIQDLWKTKNPSNCEGYVVRRVDSINYSEFRHKFGKFVRKNHVQTVKHWMHGQAIEKNILKITS